MNVILNEWPRINRLGPWTAMLLTFVLSAPAPAAPRIHGEAHEFNLERKVDSLEISNKDSLTLLRHLGKQGFTSSAEVLEFRSLRFTIASKDQSIRKTLDDALKQAPDYKWDSSNKMVRISPKRVPPENSPLRALDRPLPECVSSGLAVTNSIMFISQQAKAAGLQVLAPPARSTAAWQETSDREPGDAQLIVDIRTPITLRACLDAIVSADSPAFWLAAPSPDGKNLVLMGDSGHVHKEKSREQVKIRQRPPRTERALPGNRGGKPKQ